MAAQRDYIYIFSQVDFTESCDTYWNCFSELVTMRTNRIFFSENKTKNIFDGLSCGLTVQSTRWGHVKPVKIFLNTTFTPCSQIDRSQNTVQNLMSDYGLQCCHLSLDISTGSTMDVQNFG